MLGFIGSGNMASAIIKGIVSSAFLKGEEIAVFNKSSEKALALKEKYGVNVFSSAKEIAENCDKIVLSVKPNVIAEVSALIKDTVKEKSPLILSVAAGKTLENLSAMLGTDARIIRIMPNINAVVGEAVSALCKNEAASESDMEFAKKLCSSFGTAVQIPEKQFSIFTAIGGCSPAFVYMFIDSLSRAAVKNGMSKKTALEVSAQAVLGSAKMILESEEHPWELVDKVCSPGGTTIEGVLSLQKNGFEASVCEAVNVAFEKDQKL